MTDTRYAKWGLQTDFNTAVEPDEYLLLVGENIKLRHDAIRNIRQERSAAVYRSLSNMKHTEGSFDTLLSYRQLNTLLSRCMDTPTTTNPATAVDVSTFAADAHFEALPLTIDIARDEAIHRYVGMIVEGLRLSMGTGDRHFGVSLDFIGKTEGPAQALETVTASEFKRPEEIGGTPATTPFELEISDGVTTWTATVDMVDISIKWNRFLRHPERSATPTGFIGGGVISTRVKAKWLYEADTEFLLDAYRDRTDVSVTLTMQGEQIGATGYYSGFVATFPQCIMLAEPPTLKNAGFGNIDFTFDFLPLLNAGAGPFSFVVTSDNGAGGGGE